MGESPRRNLPVITTSERTCFRRCPQRWYWQYRMGLIPIGESIDALWFGIGIHEALALWYREGKKRGPHPAKTFAEWCGEEERWIRASTEEWDDEAKYEDARELGIAMLEGYVDKYGKDSNWYVISTERSFKIRLRDREGNVIVEFWSTWDGVYRDENDGRIYLMEHKTASQIQTMYLTLDDQGGSYWAVATMILRAEGVLKPKETIAGITYNFLRKAMPDERPRDATGAYLNKDGSVSKRQPAPYFIRENPERFPDEQATQVERLTNEVKWMNAIRDGSLPVIKSTTKDCPFCPFFDMCVLHERGGDDWQELMRAEYVQRNPYERYVKSATL